MTKRIIRWICERSVLTHGKVSYGIGKKMSDVIPEGLLSDKRLDQLIEAGKIRIEYDAGDEKSPVVTDLETETEQPKQRGRKPKTAGPVETDPETEQGPDEDSE